MAATGRAPRSTAHQGQPTGEPVEQAETVAEFEQVLAEIPQPAPRLLHAKLADVMAEIERVPKSGWNDFHRYAYATEADVADLIRKELGKRKVMIVPEYHHHHRQEHPPTSGGREQWLHFVTLRLTFVDGESGEREVSDGWLGVGIDSDDKGYYKAYTGAMKYALMKTFMVSTGDDPENDEADQREARTSAGGGRQQRSSAPAQRGRGERPAWTKEPATDGQRRMIFAKLRDAGVGLDDQSRDWRDRLVAYKTLGEVQEVEKIRRGDVDDVKGAITAYQRDPEQAQSIMNDYFSQHPAQDPWNDDAAAPPPVNVPDVEDDDDIPFE